MVFEKAYESSITFQSLLYANVPAESPSYAPTFFQEFEMKWISMNSQDWGRIGGGMCMCVWEGGYKHLSEPRSQTSLYGFISLIAANDDGVTCTLFL